MPAPASTLTGPGTDNSVALSLLSLSLAAAAARESANNTGTSGTSPPSKTPASAQHPTMKHRRLSSTGQTKRRLSDARDAAARPSLAILQGPAPSAPRVTPSLVQHSPSRAYIPPSTSPGHASLGVAIPGAGGPSPPEADERALTPASSVILDDGAGEGGKPLSGKGSGKKRSTTFTCESCSKVYRHPSCLIKHRWEHSPHWREASKFVLSKHQQVQLLEAAAILSHMSTSPTGTSLPEDRSLWPSFLSGGLLPPPVGVSQPTVSSSLPANGGRAPRMHDYPLPGQDAPTITQVRPGLLGVPTGSTPTPGPPPPPPVPPYSHVDPLDVGERYRREADAGEAWAPKMSYAASSFHESSLRGYATPTQSTSFASDSAVAPPGGWSLPRSDLRSSSASSSSSFGSSPDSGVGEDEEEMVDVEGDDGVYVGWRRRLAEPVKEEDEDGIEGDWAGMDMDMD